MPIPRRISSGRSEVTAIRSPTRDGSRWYATSTPQIDCSSAESPSGCGSRVVSTSRAYHRGTMRRMGEDETAGVRGSPDNLLPEGRVGRYVITDTIGRGGMGVVYSAYDERLDRAVALKLLHGAGSTSAGRARLVREARALAKLQHPNVVAVHDAQT